MIGSLSAQFKDWWYVDKELLGPVKQITTISSRQDDPMEVRKTIVRFDSVGRIAEREEFETRESGKLELSTKYVYQYTKDNCCLRYQNAGNGNCVGMKKFCFNSEGQVILAYDYHNGNLSFVDSLVYDSQGRLIEKYNSVLPGKMLFTYDSVGRIIEKRSTMLGECTTYTYQPTGCYTIQKTDMYGKKHIEKYIVNSKGQLVKTQEGNFESIISYYDPYGNWLKSEGTLRTLIGRYKSTTKREIEYYK